MSVKLPMPTQFDGRHPQLREWSGDVKAYPTKISTLRTTWTIQQSPLGRLTSAVSNMPVENAQYRDHKYPIQPTEDEADELEDYNEVMMSIKQKRDEILSIRQTLNHALAHAAKPGSEPHTMLYDASCAQPMALKLDTIGPTLHWWSRSSTIFTTAWLEDINRYESENRAIADHVKTTTILNHLKGPMNQHLTLKVTNTTTFDEAHGCMNNFFNSIYIGVEEDNTVGGIDTKKTDQLLVIALLETQVPRILPGSPVSPSQ
eukprot:5055132-Amphidinium_carterae.1